MKKAMLILNPSSGKEEALKHKESVLSTLHEMGYEVTLKETEKEYDATVFAEQACHEKYDAVVSMGGDGTLNETITGLANQEDQPTLGIIPLGTVNDFARALNIPMDPEQAIEQLKTAQPKRVDIGKINDKYFMNIIALGGIAEATFGVSVEQKTKLGPLAYMIEGFKTIREKEPFDMVITYDGQKWEGNALLFLMALTNSVGGFEKLAPDAEVNDGKLHCFIIKDVPLYKLVAIMTSLLKGTLEDDENVEYFTAGEVHVDSGKDLISNVDGDEGAHVPLTVKVLKSHIPVFCPVKSE
ncbi:diacylglycerol kinase family protein [Jeotgalibacillus sp. R-1-5s-1]|uniref:diacylglycerol/lipid kinase family protein n=1 Tax=Jeotgalibacillus sp. R-1-5s-1 TaxID=2555897 RepID=UPI001069A199|nr:diacylglycerol kinase family protein [Jeotgalibacillus sp. R-1-5s-1]TFE02507.1 diacylglycerol kinase family lipid kinase [Jeotgalibacillus sp. R-1-5s-1]